MSEPRFTVRVTAEPSRPARVFARKHSFEAGAPLSFDAEHPQVSALEYLLGALGAEVAGGLRALGKKRRVEVNEVEVLVQAELHDPLVYLRVVDRHGDPGIARIEVKAYISSFDEEQAVRRLWQEVLEVCPVVNTLKKAVDLRIAYQQVL